MDLKLFFHGRVRFYFLNWCAIKTIEIEMLTKKVTAVNICNDFSFRIRPAVNFQLFWSKIYLNLRLFPLLDVWLLDLEVNAFDTLAAAHDFDATQEWFEIVQNTASRFQETGQPVLSQNWYQLILSFVLGFMRNSPRVVGHMFREIGQQDR